MSENKSFSKTNFFLGFFVGMALLSTIAFFTLLVVVFSNRQAVNSNTAKANDVQANEQANNENQPDAQVQPVAGPRVDELFLGGKDASVVLIEYTDLECPYCLRHHATMKQVISAYGNKIKYVLRHFPLSFHANAQKAAEAVECATDQGKRFEMVDYVFDMNSKKSMSVENWKKGAQQLGLNAKTFNDCLDNSKTAKRVGQSLEEGSASGVDGTPATFVNGQLVSGALPLENFKSMIDSLLK